MATTNDQSLACGHDTKPMWSAARWDWKQHLFFFKICMYIYIYTFLYPCQLHCKQLKGVATDTKFGSHPKECSNCGRSPAPNDDPLKHGEFPPENSHWNMVRNRWQLRNEDHFHQTVIIPIKPWHRSTKHWQFWRNHQSFQENDDKFNQNVTGFTKQFTDFDISNVLSDAKI